MTSAEGSGDRRDDRAREIGLFRYALIREAADPGLSSRERGLLVRVEPRSRQVVGFSIPQFKAWHAEHAEADGGFEVDLPSTWPLGPDETPSEG